ncbi:hypothetical protein EB796_013728 [Bugula neritina]|uniref:Uncharacterized protein n=1 Tax=Bugula neritina TaxID=10212 RepID=A0A7J7JPQ8_BUGNE|nr:hypothetical protein EB796_013728 [Bugula neritina]
MVECYVVQLYLGNGCVLTMLGLIFYICMYSDWHGVTPLYYSNYFICTIYSPVSIGADISSSVHIIV